MGEGGPHTTGNTCALGGVTRTEGRSGKGLARAPHGTRAKKVLSREGHSGQGSLPPAARPGGFGDQGRGAGRGCCGQPCKPAHLWLPQRFTLDVRFVT